MSLRLKAKETVYKHCSLVGKVVSHRVRANNSDTTHYTGIDKFNKWIVDK